MEKLKFFKFQGTCYYALIKAVDSTHALELYDQLVSKIDTKEDEDNLISEMAELKLSEVLKEMKSYRDSGDTPLSDSTVLDWISDNSIFLLGIDGSLV
ncbi:hypothetical protein [Enterococcus sp. DIV1314a]|uniref:hypothetical protein n=1 Tax=Enterococcus sp. DIV1314a TaxID=2774660 RepID=UPI003F204B40